MNQRSRLKLPAKASSWMLLARNAGFKPELMAEQAGVSLGHLRRMCRAQFGEPFGSWLRNERMVAARQLLAETVSVKVTAERLGYRQRSHFSREFRQTYGVSAIEWLGRFKVQSEG